jgi:hypothetical protein
MTRSAHRMMPIPPDKSARNVLPQFSDVTHEIGPIGTPCKVCACCEKSFTLARKPRLSCRIYPADWPVPVCFLYYLCGSCAWSYRKSGPLRERVVAAVQRFALGDAECPSTPAAKAAK